MPGQRLNSQARNLVANLIAYFTAERDNKGPLISLNAVQERVANALKISMRTVSNIKVASQRNEVLTTPGKYRPRKKAKTEDLHESYKMDVRNTVYDMYAAKKHVTIKTLKEELRQKGIVDASYGTLRTLLLHLGFKFKKDDNRRTLTETSRIACTRAAFLRKYMENKNSDSARTVVFVGETRIFSTGEQAKPWQEENGRGARKSAGSNGKRFVVLHAGCGSGFIDNASLVFATKSKLIDYHSDISADMFTDWVENKLIPNLKTPSLVIMDNASYRSVEVEIQPSSSWKSAEIVAWLDKNHIPTNALMLRAELLHLAKTHKKPVKYKVDQLLQQHGHEILRLPRYHCEFSAIEMILTDAKNFYNKHIGEDGCNDAMVLETWDKALQLCTPEVWHAKVKHAENLVEEWYNREKFLEQVPEVNVNVTSDEESDEEYSSSE